MDLKKHEKIRRICFRINKAMYFIGSLFLVSFGAYFICYPPDITMICYRAIYFIIVSGIGIFIFIGFIISVFMDYSKEEIKNE